MKIVECQQFCVVWHTISDIMVARGVFSQEPREVDCVHFGDEETEDQNVLQNCQRSQCQEVAKLRLEPEQV